jgi:hypothetical protein
MEFKLPKKDEIVLLKEIKEICVHFNLMSLWNKIENNIPQNPFKSDGCSCWPDCWKNRSGEKISLYQACFIHDLHYWAGYSGENIARFLADVQLMINVVLETEKIYLGVIMFLGVTIVGSDRFKTSFCWGFGRN